MFSDFIKNHKVAVTAVGLLLIGLIGFSAYVAISRTSKESVSVYLVPSDTKLTANGEQLKPGTAYLTPGEYTIEASRSGFKTETKKITITTRNTQTIDIALVPNSDSAAQWAKDNEEIYLDHEGRAGLRANQEGETFSTLNPITSKLPYENLIYTIGYRADPSDSSGNSIILTVNTQDGYRDAAIEKIRDLGYEPTNFKIEFKNYESPFDHE